jgi:PAS domain S-box-containing protein
MSALERPEPEKMTTSFAKYKMRDRDKTKEQLSHELESLRKRVEELSALHQEQKKALESLKAMEQKYTQLVENSPDIIYMLDPDGHFTFVGGASENLLGFKAEDLIGKHFTSLIQPEDVEKAKWHFNERRTGERATRGFDVRLLSKEGQRKHFDIKDLSVEVNAFGIYDEPGSKSRRRFLGTYGVARDITEHKLAQEQLEKTVRELQETRDLLIHSEKLAAIGQLTAGVAHEILNPVNIMSMRLQVLKQRQDLSDESRKALAVCDSQLGRITEIIDDLGQFSRVHKRQVNLCDLNRIIEQVLNLTALQLNDKGIKTVVEYAPELPLIPLEENRIEQVLFNLISNAAEAMAEHEKRVLRVTAKQVPSDDHVQVIISDTGTGIDKASINKVFDPFFTTKKSGQGTGLGLFISYNIIKHHGGKIWAENNDGGGATFFIELPLGTDGTM